MPAPRLRGTIRFAGMTRNLRGIHLHSLQPRCESVGNARLGFERLAQPRDRGGRQSDASHKSVEAIDQFLVGGAADELRCLGFVHPLLFAAGRARMQQQAQKRKRDAVHRRRLNLVRLDFLLNLCGKGGIQHLGHVKDTLAEIGGTSVSGSALLNNAMRQASTRCQAAA